MQIISLKQKLQTIGFLMLMVFAFVPVKTEAAYSEDIKSFASTLKINNDGTVNVLEKIVYEFGTNQRHGIFRDITLSSKDAPTISISNVAVTDSNGMAYPFTQSEDSALHLKIGDPNNTISGEKEYDISYTVSNVIRGFSNYDEFYWNATGNAWTVPISYSSAEVQLPSNWLLDPAVLPKIQNSCYPGTLNMQKAACTITSSDDGGTYVFSSGPTDPGQGLTIDTSFPKRLVTNLATGTPVDPSKKTTTQKILGILIPIGTGLFVIIFAIFFVLSNRKVIIPKELKGQPIAPWYDAPEEVNAADIAYLLNRSFDKKEFGLIFIDLAVKGYLKIKYIPKQSVFSSEDYAFLKLKEDDGLEPAYKRLFDYLFTGVDTVLLSDIKSDNRAVASVYSKIGDDLRSKLINKDYLKASALNLKNTSKFGGGGVLVFALAFAFRPLLIISVPLICLIFIIAYYRNLNNVTPSGIELFKKILGFKDFLTLTESDRLRLLNAPSLKPEMFEKFLPYAMAFGIEKEWAKKFESLAITPSWYEDSRYGYGAPINTLILANFIGNLNSGVASASTYSSGRNGAGYSGGGSGGGGGGSW
ncbi:MAG: hypothetical protein JWO40_546 [Candidatus Doudnabacteria bacterium]|nr:hypothetical protein [Candidatus Doudnabacteria bacterium]